MEFSDISARMYNLHEQQELYYRNSELFDALTVCNRIHPNNTIPHHLSWTVILEATTNAKRTKGIKGSAKFSRQCKYRCLKKMKVYVYLYPTCTRDQYVLLVYNTNHKEWPWHSDNWRKMKVIEENRGAVMNNEDIFALIENNIALYKCKYCNGACWDGSV